MGEWSAGWADRTFRDAMRTPKKRRKKRRPTVVIEEAECRLCGCRIVTGRIQGSDSGLRLTYGCKATFGVVWRPVAAAERPAWVRQFWAEKESR